MTLGTLAVSAPLYLGFDKSSSALQFVESAEIPVNQYLVATRLTRDGVNSNRWVALFE